MKKIKTAVAVLIALTSIASVSVSAFAHHGGGHHNNHYRNVNYCSCGNNYIDANNDGICDNCNYTCYGHSSHGQHRYYCH